MGICSPGGKAGSVMPKGVSGQRGLALRVSDHPLACEATSGSMPPNGRSTLLYVSRVSGGQHWPRHKPDVLKKGPRSPGLLSKLTLETASGLGS